jgi:hypothetical protein
MPFIQEESKNLNKSNISRPNTRPIQPKVTLIGKKQYSETVTLNLTALDRFFNSLSRLFHSVITLTHSLSALQSALGCLAGRWYFWSHIYALFSNMFSIFRPSHIPLGGWIRRGDCVLQAPCDRWVPVHIFHHLIRPNNLCILLNMYFSF